MGGAFGNPCALGLLALAVPIVLAYRRRRRAAPCETAAAAIWVRVLAARPTWRRWLAVRDRAALAIQLVALALIALAAAEPAADWPLCESLVVAAAALLLIEAWAYQRWWTS